MTDTAAKAIAERVLNASGDSLDNFKASARKAIIKAVSVAMHDARNDGYEIARHSAAQFGINLPDMGKLK